MLISEVLGAPLNSALEVSSSSPGSMGNCSRHGRETCPVINVHAVFPPCSMGGLRGQDIPQGRQRNSVRASNGCRGGNQEETQGCAVSSWLSVGRSDVGKLQGWPIPKHPWAQMRSDLTQAPNKQRN